MTEKEIKAIINDSKMNQEMIGNIQKVIVDVIRLLEEKMAFCQVEKYHLCDALALSVMTNKDKVGRISLNCQLLKSQLNDNKNYSRVVILNEIENILLLFTDYSINRDNSSITITNEVLNYTLKINVLENEEYLDEEKWKLFVEEKSQKYTLLKNSIIFLKEYNTSVLDDNQLTLLLIDGLSKENVLNKYSEYINAFIKSLDENVLSLRTLINPVNNTNILKNIDDIKITEIRNYKKKLQKLFEELPTEILGTAQLTLNVLPIENEDTYSWSYKIEGTALNSQGGEFPKTSTAYSTAILKGIFKGLKYIVESNNIYTKNIVITGCNEDILTCIPKIAEEQENNSRRKTISAYINNNKIKCKFIKK